MKDPEARVAAARAEAAVAEITHRLDSLARQVGMIPANITTAVDDVMGPSIDKFNAASDTFNAHVHLTQQLIEQVGKMTAQINELIDHGNIVAEEVDSIRTTVTNLDRSIDHMKNTFAALGKSA